MESFNEKLKLLRKAAELSKADLARRAGISQSSLSRFEHVDLKRRRLPHPGTLAALARALGVDRAELETPDILAGRVSRGRLACRATHEGWAPAHVAESAVIAGTPRVGAGTTIGHFVVLDALHDDIIIGPGCELGAGVHVLTRAVGKNGNVLTGPVKCGSHVVVGSNAMLLPGTVLGDGVVVLPGTTHGLGALLKAPSEVADGDGLPRAPDGADPTC